MRVVLYAEGPAEAPTFGPIQPAPGESLLEEELGPGHILVRRCIRETRKIPEEAVHFEAPLRTRGRVARGSHLKDRRRLRQLCSWADPQRKPELVVVLVDRDGDTRLRRRLTAYLADFNFIIIAIAIEEFEAWLIADVDAVRASLERTIDEPSNPERMRPGEAKEWFSQVANVAADQRGRFRRDIEQNCDLEIVRRKCRAFRTFLGHLQHVPID